MRSAIMARIIESSFGSCCSSRDLCWRVGSFLLSEQATSGHKNITKTKYPPSTIMFGGPSNEPPTLENGPFRPYDITNYDEFREAVDPYPTEEQRDYFRRHGIPFCRKCCDPDDILRVVSYAMEVTQKRSFLWTCAVNDDQELSFLGLDAPREEATTLPYNRIMADLVDATVLLRVPHMELVDIRFHFRDNHLNASLITELLTGEIARRAGVEWRRRTIQSLSLCRHCYWTDEEWMEEAFVQLPIPDMKGLVEAILGLPSLQELHIPSCIITHETIRALCDVATRIRSLEVELEWRHNTFDIGLLADILSTRPCAIEKLTVEQCLPEFFMTPEVLRSIYREAAEKFLDSCLCSRRVTEGTLIKSISLSGFVILEKFSVGEEMAVRILKSYPHLEELQHDLLARCNGFDRWESPYMDFMRSVLHNPSDYKLRNLSLSICPEDLPLFNLLLLYCHCRLEVYRATSLPSNMPGITSR